MKKLFVPVMIGLSALTILSGCSISLGGGTTTRPQTATTGQQLLDLQKAKDAAGAISDAEYQTKKSKLLAE